MTEQQLQESVCKYIELKYPKVLYCASAGGMRTNLKTAVKMKRAGYKKGFPDLFIYERMRGYNGLAIEIKKDKGYPSKEQKEWIKSLNDRGYFAEVRKGFDSIVELIDWYFEK
jgi:hypothetical protein